MTASTASLPTFQDGLSRRQRALVAHALCVLADAQKARRLMTLDLVCLELGVTDVPPARDGVRLRTTRREDVRSLLASLDAEGYVDATRMRLTLPGFALAQSFGASRVG